MKKIYKIGVAIFATFLTTAVSAQVVSITPQSPTGIGNCIPFGVEDYNGSAFVYQNIPAFSMQVGDTIAFDLGFPNDFDILRNIYITATTTNGGSVSTQWVQIVTAQIPSSPKGDNIVGNYELQYVSEQNFSFAGGGLIIGFEYINSTDQTCGGVLVKTTGSDASNYFVRRAFYITSFLDSTDITLAGSGTTEIGGFVITEGVCRDAAFNLALTKTNLKLTSQEDSASYQWLDCSNNDSVLPADTNRFITGAVGAEYKVVITNADGCTDTSECVAIIKITPPSGINAAYADGINVTPNPTKGLTMITLPNSYTEYNLSVYDLVGKEVINKSNVIGENTELNLNGLEKGVYFLKISDGNNYNRSLQIIKE